MGSCIDVHLGTIYCQSPGHLLLHSRTSIGAGKAGLAECRLESNRRTTAAGTCGQLAGRAIKFACPHLPAFSPDLRSHVCLRQLLSLATNLLGRSAATVPEGAGGGCRLRWQLGSLRGQAPAVVHVSVRCSIRYALEALGRAKPAAARCRHRHTPRLPCNSPEMRT